MYLHFEELCCQPLKHKQILAQQGTPNAHWLLQQGGRELHLQGEMPALADCLHSREDQRQSFLLCPEVFLPLCHPVKKQLS